MTQQRVGDAADVDSPDVTSIDALDANAGLWWDPNPAALGAQPVGNPIWLDSDDDDDMAARRKFEAPPKFYGKESEDAQEWLERYESAGRANNWQPADMAQSFELYLEDSARKWYMCTTLPNHWEDAPAVQAIGGLQPAPAIPAVPGLRTKFLNEFKPDDQRRFKESILEKRRQGMDESISHYYYDVLDLCRAVDPNMPEQMRLRYLFRGMKPGLKEQVWVTNPATTEDFLSTAKKYAVAATLNYNSDWPTPVMSSIPEQREWYYGPRRPETTHPTDRWYTSAPHYGPTGPEVAVRYEPGPRYGGPTSPDLTDCYAANGATALAETNMTTRYGPMPGYGPTHAARREPSAGYGATPVYAAPMIAPATNAASTELTEMKKMLEDLRKAVEDLADRTED